MSRISRLVVLMTTVAAVAGAVSATAGAVTWHASGSTAFTATSGPQTLTSTGVNLACVSSTATASAVTGSIVGAVYSGISGSMSYSGCLLAGQSTSVSCRFRFTGINQPVTAVTTTGNLDLTCDMTIVGNPLCHLSGVPHALYTNPASGLNGKLTVTASTVHVGNAAPNNCPMGPTDNGVTLTEFTLVHTPGPGPILHRTA